MHRISRAPVLSATRSRDSCWITSVSSSASSPEPELGRTLALLRSLDDLDDPPALRRRQRPRLHEQNPVTGAAGVALVVGLEPAGAAQDLAVERVLDPVLDDHDDGLVHLVAHHDPLPHLAAFAGGGLGGLCVLTHAVTSDGS